MFGSLPGTTARLKEYPRGGRGVAVTETPPISEAPGPAGPVPVFFARVGIVGGEGFDFVVDDSYSVDPVSFASFTTDPEQGVISFTLTNLSVNAFVQATFVNDTENGISNDYGHIRVENTTAGKVAVRTTDAADNSVARPFFLTVYDRPA